MYVFVSIAHLLCMYDGLPRVNKTTNQQHFNGQQNASIKSELNLDKNWTDIERNRD